MTKYKKLLVLPCTVILICGYIIGFNMIKRADRAAEISDAAAVANVNTNTNTNVNDDRQTNENSDGDADGKEAADSAEEDKEEAKDAKDTDDNKNAELAAIGHKININTADEKELMLLDGIGETYAKRITELRTQLGGFTSIEQLKKVKGIGDKRFEKLKDYVTVE